MVQKCGECVIVAWSTKLEPLKIRQALQVRGCYVEIVISSEERSYLRGTLGE